MKRFPPNFHFSGAVQARRVAQYASQAVDPEEWLSMGATLRANAELLLASERPRDLPVLDTYRMLAAFALENFFKARILPVLQGRAREEIESTGRFPDIARSHDLVDLAKKAGFKGRAPDHLNLWRLTSYAVWRGRYPVSLSPDEGIASGGRKARSVFSRGPLRSIEVESVTHLLDRVETWARERQ